MVEGLIRREESSKDHQIVHMEDNTLVYKNKRHFTGFEGKFDTFGIAVKVNCMLQEKFLT